MVMLKAGLTPRGNQIRLNELVQDELVPPLIAVLERPSEQRHAALREAVDAVIRQTDSTDVANIRAALEKIDFVERG